MQQTQTHARPDYVRIAAALDGSALDKKLEELTQRTPPRKRKRLASGARVKAFGDLSG
jgi:hypothetical protein